MKTWFLIVVFILGLLPVVFRLHLVEKDFLEIMGAADGLYTQQNYCFLEIKNYAGLAKLTGLQGRPPLIPILLASAFAIFGHNLLAIYLVYALPRLLIFPLLFLIATNFFKPRTAFCVASLPLFFPFFETYTLATLKADVFVVALSLAGLYFHLLWKKLRQTKYLLLAAIFLSLNMLSKETAIYFSVTLWLLQIKEILPSPKRKILLGAIFTPPALLVLPFIIFSLVSVGRLFPSIFATAVDLPSFPTNIVNYVASVFYMAGINFSLSKLITVASLIKLLLILLGVGTIIKEKNFELILPILLVLASISLIQTRVVQGDSINREVLHRIAPVIPFLALFLGKGSLTVGPLFVRKNHWFGSVISLWLIFSVATFFIWSYFRAPFALDYTDAEYYVNAATVFRFHPQIPLTTFAATGNRCIISYVPAGKFLLAQYRPFKTSAFPIGFKELIIGAWLIPLLVSFINLKGTRRVVPQ